MFFCRERIKHQFAKKNLEQVESEIGKCCGSSRPSGKCTYSHCTSTTYGPDKLMRQYRLRAIVTCLDFDKANVQLWDSSLHHHRQQLV